MRKVKEILAIHERELRRLETNLEDFGNTFQKKIEELEEETETLKAAVDERTQFVEDLVEGWGRQAYPGTELCKQCFGAGGEWVTEDRSHCPGGIFHWISDVKKYWWVCDTCKGTGRIPEEPVFDLTLGEPEAKKE